MRPALLRHHFYEGLDSALHMTQIPLHATFDAVTCENQQWFKRRWERQERTIKKPKKDVDGNVIKDERGQTIEEDCIVSVFLVKKERLLDDQEISEYMNCLHQMNEVIDYHLTHDADELYQLAMVYKAAFRQHQLSKHGHHFQIIQDGLQKHSPHQFHLDMYRTMARIICNEIWEANQADQAHYLQFVLE
ncbi:MAG: hypothetical protein AAFV93_08225 [Chloroflexota bacterium]